MENNLKNEVSPYLLQHKDNPVNWYPWGRAAFEKAEREDKPVFLSIGYSTCHWCHVMAHESFEDMEVSDILNRDFVCVKVDREERPDIDSIYMSVCQAFTGNGGWPTSVFITPEQKPFFAGTYYPREAFVKLLTNISILWKKDRENLLSSGDKIIKILGSTKKSGGLVSDSLIQRAAELFKKSFDKEYGGFGYAPKFPAPHNLLFLMEYYRQTEEKEVLDMAEKTLLQMYKGGMFDHIGYGFSRYSTDRYFLVPHFEKMLYDNALLIICYAKAYEITKNNLYKNVAEKTAEYVMREMTSTDGAFYSAQDADSDRVEGKYYTFDYDEIITLLGEKNGEDFCRYYGISKKGNFEGKNIPNLLHNEELNNSLAEYIEPVYRYRKSRTSLHLDDKILTAWNGLMISAFAVCYRVFKDDKYLKAAEKAYAFTEKNLCSGNTLYVSFRDKKHSSNGFLDDYAFYIYALISLYEATYEQKYLSRALSLCDEATEKFFDNENGGYYLYGKDNEQLILKPKDTYDGAMPGGNSVMAFNLVKLSQIAEQRPELIKQLKFMSGRAEDYPDGHSFFLLALSQHLHPPVKIVCVTTGVHDEFPADAAVRVIYDDNPEYPMKNGQTTYYVCRDNQCMPPVNSLTPDMF